MQISNIETSLSQGNLLNRKQFFVLYLAMSVCCLFPIITIILLAIPQVEWDMQLVILMSICDIGSFSLLSVSVYVKIKNNKLINSITAWLDGAIEVRAYSKKMNENRLGIQPKATKIQVSFTLNGQVYKKESTAKGFGGQQGYLGAFNKYADREINILYSPRYDEVLILKQKN
jgi:hypothetical protein